MSVKVWDGFVRTYHWAQVALLGLCWYSAEQGLMDWHQYSALALLGLWLGRLAWGLLGSENARFGHFVRGPRAVLAYVRGERQQGSDGHNPLAGWMVAVLLLLLGGQLGTGLFASDEVLTEGPLYGLVSEETSAWLTELHELNFNLLLGLVALHVLAALAHQFRGENLIGAMITGRKAAERSPALGNVLLAWSLVLLAWGGLYLWWGRHIG
ncbi:cytochrome b/b6 domain-containing protein [Gallaecimonas sp. GXIMD4217]|uniref:cytochrome b/b6 domain-containing protein n=1 Tax=Gallaecimonas sp. GXIMD4217 TaxID=3131927 RepID=UPI00311B3FA3